MKASIEPKPTGHMELRILVDWSEVAADYDDLLADYARLALPGFRPGKAPRAVIEQRLRQQLRDDFLAQGVRRLVREALREQNLRASGPITVVDVQFEPRREFSFTAECVPVPKLELPDYAAVRLTATTGGERLDELSEWLLDHTPWDPPEALIQQECERAQPHGSERGSDAWHEAAQRVKLMPILEQIAEAEGIELGEHDVDARIQKMAADCDAKPAQLHRQLGEDGLVRLGSLLLAEQTLAYLASGTSLRTLIPKD